MSRKGKCTRENLYTALRKFAAPAPEIKLYSESGNGQYFYNCTQEGGSTDAPDRLLLARREGNQKRSAIFISVGNCLVCRQHSFGASTVMFLMRGTGVGVCVCVWGLFVPLHNESSAQSKQPVKTEGLWTLSLWFIVLPFSSQVKLTAQQRSEAVGLFRVEGVTGFVMSDNSTSATTTLCRIVIFAPFFFMKSECSIYTGNS